MSNRRLTLDPCPTVRVEGRGLLTVNYRPRPDTPNPVNPKEIIMKRNNRQDRAAHYA